MRSAGTGLYHGTWWDLHKDDQLEQVMTGRFTRLQPEDRDPVNWDDLDQLARKMTSTQEPTPTPETKARSRGGQGDNGRLYLSGPVRRP